MKARIFSYITLEYFGFVFIWTMQSMWNRKSNQSYTDSVHEYRPQNKLAPNKYFKNNID